MSNSKISLYALLSQSIRLVSGPLVLLVISATLSSEEMSFYYSFFSFVAMQQLLEMGLGFTIKQFIAHAYKEKDGKWTDRSILDIKSYFRFTVFWFLILAAFILFGIGFFGYYFFSSYIGEVSWIIPWWCLVLVSAMATGLTPILLLLEGCQKQVAVYKGKLISGLATSISTCIAMLLDFGLYSIAISVLISNIVLYIYLYPSISVMKMQLLRVCGFSKNTKKVFFELWPMLSKISVTWVMGYFFWNSFNLIAFKQFTPELAGQLGFTLALARAGYGIAESIVSSQSTVFSLNISNGNILNAKSNFNRSMTYSVSLLIFGYFSFCLTFWFFPDFFLFEKTLDIYSSIQIFAYFILLLPVTLQANFCRCFKVEPYFALSMFANISIPLVFYMVSYLYKEVYFMALIPILMIMLVWSMIIFRKTLTRELANVY
ncbi:hypothetical protein VCSRO160_1804 [Vibrio cholerae]|nr:putative O-antigen flippase [Vibrio cholerae]GHX80294.1 hypothetical protein VCSRO160_1804 [Vibrio cholerae]